MPRRRNDRGDDKSAKGVRRLFVPLYSTCLKITGRKQEMAKYQKGQSGNPSGKPKGALSPSGRLRDAIAKDLPKILSTLRDRALEGDVQAASLLLSRCLPPLRAESAAQYISVPGSSLGERAEAIVKAAVGGELPTNAAAELMGVLAGQAKILETIELERRIAALEERNETK